MATNNSVDNALFGVTNGVAAPSGYVGELLTSFKPQGSAITATSNTALNVTFINLTAGDWDLWGNVAFIPSGGATAQFIGCWISTSSATVPDGSLLSSVAQVFNYSSNYGLVAPPIALEVTTTTTVYLSAIAAFTTLSVGVCGNFYARRRR